MKKTATRAKSVHSVVTSQVDAISSLLRNHSDRGTATGMEKYMRNQFTYHGIRKPILTAIEKDWLSTTADVSPTWNHDLIKALWQKPEREHKYVAIDLLLKMKNKIAVGDLELVEYMIETESWWDTVDLIASHFLGALIKKDPTVKDTHIRKWGGKGSTSSMWLKRSAIISQLKLKSETDELLLAECLEANMGTQEFFLNKAIGWALREYSKTNQRFVKDFISLHETSLSKLSISEGSKYLSKTKRPKGL